MTRPTMQAIGRRNRTPSPVHAVPIGHAHEREHRASALCWCRPEPIYRDLATSAVIYRHWQADA